MAFRYHVRTLENLRNLLTILRKEIKPDWNGEIEVDLYGTTLLKGSKTAVLQELETQIKEGI